MGRHGLDSSGSGKRQIIGSGEYGTDILGFIKYSEFLV
jgi:hypothetical protein